MASASPGRRFLAALVLVAVLGCVLRLSHLPVKLFGGDEIYSALRIAGSSFERVRTELADGQPHPLAAWQAHLELRPGSSSRDTVQALAAEAPEHPPLFYLLARRWLVWFGPSLGSRRLLPALFSLALLPAMAALAWELWHRRRTSLLVAALVAVCPLHVLYAKEVREYSLWTTLIAVSSWLLLRALRRGGARDWLAYGLALVAMLYSQLFALGLLLSFSALPLLPRWRPAWRPLLLTHVAALLAYSPWLWAASGGAMLRQGSNLWTADTLSLPLLGWNWGLNVSRLWLDLDPGGRLISGDGPGAALLRGSAVGLGALAVVLAFAWLLRQPDRRPAVLLLALLAGSVLPLISADLLLGGSRSAIARYPMPGYLAVQLCLAAAASQLWQQRRALALMGTSVVLLLSLQSSLRALDAPTWWTKQGSIDQRPMAAAIDRFPHPLVVSEGYLPRLLSLSANLHSDASILVLPAAGSSAAAWSALQARGDRPVLLYRPSDAVLRQLPQPPTPLLRTPSRYPYLPAVDGHTRLWLMQLSAAGRQRSS